jgi:hypothetical protein
VAQLWTPGGEHVVPRPAPAPPRAPDPVGGTSPPASEEASGPITEDERQLEELADRLVAAPVEDVLANHCYGLFELAALHLGRTPANLEPARAAVDALGALVEVLGDRLGSHRATLEDALSQLRLAFVQVATATAQPGSSGPR